MAWNRIQSIRGNESLSPHHHHHFRRGRRFSRERERKSYLTTLSLNQSVGFSCWSLNSIFLFSHSVGWLSHPIAMCWEKSYESACSFPFLITIFQFGGCSFGLFFSSRLLSQSFAIFRENEEHQQRLLSSLFFLLLHHSREILWQARMTHRCDVSECVYSGWEGKGGNGRTTTGGWGTTSRSRHMSERADEGPIIIIQQKYDCGCSPA